MRLRRLHIARFKNLRDFRMSFEDRLTAVLVGPNGTGKSNVLEAIIITFRDLDLGQPPAFFFELEYECRGATVRVDADPERKAGALRITVDGEPVSRSRFAREGGGAHLPSYVFGYYSGPTNRMESHFEAHQKKFRSELLGGVDQPLRPPLYARLVHSQFVLLSFFRSEDQDRAMLADFLRIEDLDSVLFVLKKPDWYDPGRRASGQDQGDPRFWYARGVVKKLLGELYDLALAPMRSKDRERVYLFLKTKEDLARLARGHGGQQDFFKALEHLYISDLIADVRTNVKIRGADSSLTFRELSEGEQQLLMVLGLLRFIDDEEGHILLDEPDTHLNPAWGLRYTHLLKEHVADKRTTQIIMASHDPLVVASLTAAEVQIMRRDADGRVTAEHSSEDPKGMGIAGLLTSELYGLRSALDPGLEAQRAAVAAHAGAAGGRIVAEHVEVESGRKKDRPQLAAALEACRALRAALVIAKLDRLARNVAFVSNLMESGAEFVAADMPTVNRLTVHILAAVAEEEARMISARTKAALAAAKARGVVLGNPRLLARDPVLAARANAVQVDNARRAWPRCSPTSTPRGGPGRQHSRIWPMPSWPVGCRHRAAGADGPRPRSAGSR